MFENDNKNQLKLSVRNRPIISFGTNFPCTVKIWTHCKKVLILSLLSKCVERNKDERYSHRFYKFMKMKDIHTDFVNSLNFTNIQSEI